MRIVQPIASREKRRATRSTVIAGVVVATLTIGGVAGVAAGETIRAGQVEDATAELAAAQSRLDLRLAEQQTTVATVTERMGAAQGVLDSSAGRVLDNSVRQQLADVLTAVTRDKVQTVRAMARAQKAVALTPDPPAVAVDLVAAAAKRDGLLVAADMSPFTLLPTLEDASAEVIAAEAQWQAEQERLAAEAARLAAEAAARAEAERAAQAAAQAAADAAAREAPAMPPTRSAAPPAASRSTAPAPPPAQAAPTPAPFDEYVWAAGGQGELDACKGSVDLTGIYGFPVIGEHWSCGGSRFPTTEGTTIRLSGVLAGLYRVGPVVAILNQKTNKTWDAPSNHDLLYQTCINGLNTQMSYTALTRIG